MMKKKQIIPIALLAMFIGITNVNAYQFSVGYADTGQGGTTKPREDITHEWEAEIDGNYKTAYTCKYNYTISVSKNITINGYDMENNEIMRHSLKISEDNEILAGTSLGLNIYETKSVSWTVTKAEVTYNRKRRYRYYKCTYKNAAPAQDLIQTIASINTLPRLQMIANACNTKTKLTTSSSACPDPATGCEYESGPTWTNSFTEYNYSTSSSPPANELAEKQKECTGMATKAAIEAANKYFYSSYEVQLSDSNDVNGSEVVTITNDDANKTIEYYKNGSKMTSCGSGACKFKYDPDLTTQPTTDSRTVKFYYKKNNVCINVKTSKITYRNTACADDEMKVKNETIGGLEHWHYFLPLNAKSSDEIELNLLPSYGGDLNKSECNYVMKNNPVYYDGEGAIIKTKTSYLDLIIPKVDGRKFEGNYCYNLNGTEKCNENSNDFKEIENNGCYLTSKVKLPTKQGFYNEIEEQNKNIKFNGFNFYYRPINITEPFPNGIVETSLWKKWDESQTKSPDISDSYSVVTYVAQNIDAAKVRKYKQSKNCGSHEECSYTNWGNMNIEGKSGFIETEGIVQRGSNLNFYKLGCGPLNKNKKLENGTNNPLYIEGCGS